jgi:hypothetical protein
MNIKKWSMSKMYVEFKNCFLEKKLCVSLVLCATVAIMR